MEATNHVGFDNEKYLREQTSAILERVSRFNDKLYLEFGGKILYDYHAARVLPGFDPNVKMRLLQLLKDKIDVILCIHAGDIERKKVRADFGITYDIDALKSIDDLREWGIDVTAVVITRYENQSPAKAFKNKLELRGIKVYLHYPTIGYPTDIDLIVSDKGYGANEYIKTTNPIVIVTGPGPGSGKLATCLCNLYHEYKNGVKAGYAKFETFPIWDLPIDHKVNIAYEAATVDLKDEVLIDTHHLKAYNAEVVNYNRDIEAFHLLKRIIEKITGGESMYQSPTDMGVNRVSSGIVNDTIIAEASHQEIIRRYFRCAVEYAVGLADKDTLERAVKIMEKIGAKEEDRKVVLPAREAAKNAEKTGKGNEGFYCGAAIELHDGTIITGKNSPLMHASSSLILNATKHLAGIPDNMYLLPENILASVTYLKKNILNGKMVSLDLDETLIVLGISALSNPAAQMALESLKKLSDCEVHTTHIPTPGDEAGLRKLKVFLTCDPAYSSKSLFIGG
ncbi:MAG: ATP-dependent Zn protease [Bacteroidetes bacterium]|nr:ATP-dependent Zn protease [Bacteroidota bacterium]